MLTPVPAGSGSDFDSPPAGDSETIRCRRHRGTPGETIAKVRWDHYVHKKSIKEIVRSRGLSRNTVRKILRGEDTSFSYERAEQPLPKLGEHIEVLDRMLEVNEGKSRR